MIVLAFSIFALTDAYWGIILIVADISGDGVFVDVDIPLTHFVLPVAIVSKTIPPTHSAAVATALTAKKLSPATPP